MEVGAVKQAYNNEVILLKKKLNQAKIQIIHKLTRKAKTLTEKNKVPENLKEKLNRKAKAAVNEVLIIKKVTHKELAKFAISHSGDLKSYLNKPNVDKEKAYARLLLHKALQDKYEFLRNRFSKMPVEDLVMSREERRKRKKEEKEKQKNKKKGKANNIDKSVSSEGGWSVEDLPVSDSVISKVTVKKSDGSDIESDDDSGTNYDCHAEENQSECDNVSNVSIDDNNVGESEENSIMNESNDEENDKTNDNDMVVENKEETESSRNVGTLVKINNKKSPKNQVGNKNKKPIKEDNRKKIPKQNKDGNKNKNLTEKIHSNKFKEVKKMFDEKPIEEKKIVDSFFMTSTGENYMSLAEPRAPDEVKEDHKQGNRQMRRAAKFGHEMKFKPRRDNNFGPNNGRFRDQNNKFDRSNNNFDRPNNKFDRQNNYNNDRGFKNNKPNEWARQDKEDSGKHLRQSFNKANNVLAQKSAQPEKLHPSWEAKKKISSIVPFQGKKITFE